MINEKLYKRLKEAAHLYKPVTYKEIIPLAGLDHLQGDVLSGALGRVLWEIVYFDHQQGRPMLSAMTLSTQSNSPGEGFFRAARDLGRFDGHSNKEKEEFLFAEMKACRDYWSKVE